MSRNSSGRPPGSHPPDGNDPHVDVLALITGETSPALRPEAVAHARSCARCRDELVLTAATLGELRDASRYDPVDPAEVPPTVGPHHGR